MSRSLYGTNYSLLVLVAQEKSSHFTTKCEPQIYYETQDRPSEADAHDTTFDMKLDTNLFQKRRRAGN